MSLQLPPGVPLDKLPTSPPPPGVAPLQTDAYPAYRNQVLLGVSISFTIITGVLVFGRVYLNCSTKGRRPWWDDAFAVIGLLLEIGFMGLRVAYRDYFRYLWDIPLSWFIGHPGYFKADYVTNIILGPAQFFAKGSILLLYLRLFYPHRSTRIIIYVLLAFAFCLYFINVPIEAYYCTPRPGQGWTLTGNTDCRKTILLGPTQGAFNVVLDIIILALPFREISKLNLSFQKRRLLFGVFATGALAVVASIVGLAYRCIMYKETNLGFLSWYSYSSSLCVVLETYITLCCSSAPAFASLLQNRETSTSQRGLSTSLRSRLRSLLGMSSANRSQPQSTTDSTASSAAKAAEGTRHSEQKTSTKRPWHFRVPGMSALSSDHASSRGPYDSNGISNMTGRGYWELDRTKEEHSSLDSKTPTPPEEHDLESQAPRGQAL